MAPKASPPKKGRKSTGEDDAPIDRRKMRDEFRKPIEDIPTLVHDFVIKREVPTAVLVAQAEAMQGHVDQLAARSGLLGARIEALKAEFPPPSFQIAQLSDEKRRLDQELAKLQAKFVGRRDGVLAKTAADLVTAMEAYQKMYDDSLKLASEREALAAVCALCEPFTAEKREEREEPAMPRQPADLGDLPTHARALMQLATRAEAASQPGGPLERLASAAADAGGSGCQVEMAAVKSFRRALQKAEEDCGGDYLALTDMARCSIIARDLASLHEVLRFLIKGAAEQRWWAGARWLVYEGSGAAAAAAAEAMADEGGPPAFEALYCHNGLSRDCDVESEGTLRQLTIVGRLAVEATRFVNVELVLHTRKLYEMRSTIAMLHEGRAALDAHGPAAEHEGDLTREAIGRAAQGTIRRLVCLKGRTALGEDVRDGLIAMMQSGPCLLTHLHLTSTPGLEGTQLGGTRYFGGLLLPAAGTTLECHRLRSLRLSSLGLEGPLPEALAQCVWLHTLELQDNRLIGEVPEALGSCSRLHTLALHGNRLRGLVPAAALAQLTSLCTLTLGGGGAPGNEGLYITRSAATALETALAYAEQLLLPRMVEDDALEAAAVEAKGLEEAAAQARADKEAAAADRAARVD